MNADFSVAPQLNLPAFSARAEEKLITTIDQLKTFLPQFDEEMLRGLLEISRGPEEGCMKTLGYIHSVDSRQTFTFDEKGLPLPSQELFALDLESEASRPSIIRVPEYLEFTAEWDQHPITSGEGNNILGDNGGLYFEQSCLQIPVVQATNETLAYYGALLIPEGEAVRFPNVEAYPLWKMHVGPRYVDDFLMTEEGGGGFYLEYHHDQPHFHYIVNGGGYYLLAKEVSEKTFHVTAFELSNGQAVYTKKGAIHCDAALKGDLIVGYTASNDCSTVLLRTKEDKSMVRIDFV